MDKIGLNSTQTSITDSRNQKATGISALNADTRLAGQPESASTTDTVAISTQAVDLAELEARISQLPDIDAAKVVDLHNRIVNGDYRVDSDRVAGKILNFEADL